MALDLKLNQFKRSYEEIDPKGKYSQPYSCICI